MKKIKLIEVSSDLGGKKPGASLSMDAVRIASYSSAKTKDFYTRFENLRTRINAPNDTFHLNYKHSFAKRIEHIYPVCKQTSNEVSDSILQNDFTIVISGDHSTAAGTIAGVKQAYPEKRLGIVWIDAHTDVHNPYTSESSNMHGMPLGTAINDNNLECKYNDIDSETAEIWEKLTELGNTKSKVNMSDVVYVAVRDYEDAEKNLIIKYNNKIYSTNDVRQEGVEKIANKIIKDLEHCDIVYVSFDVDSMDPNVSSGTGTPFENGLFEYEAKKLLKTLVCCDKVKCLEISEVNPLLDTENKMAIAVFNIIKSVCRVVDLS
ncbi:MAG: arginase [Bacteroidetes bacterium]|nr:arginase [Bacteroidota bacterium]